jgi:outer membrane protein assembly factor BamB
MVRLSVAVAGLVLTTAFVRGGDDEALLRVTLSGESTRTKRRLDEADQLAKATSWPQAVDAYMQLMTEAGDDLVPLTPRQAVQARRLCFQRLAASPEALRLYRSRVDIQAKQWLREGKAARDVSFLRRVIDDAFCSGCTDQALHLLGDLAFERGAFEEAEHWWAMLALPASRIHAKDIPGNELVYPDPQRDLAVQARAKQIVALLFLGEREAAGFEMKAFTSLHGDAAGHLCGQDGNYTKILQGLISAGPSTVQLGLPETWPTFASGPERRGHLSKARGMLAHLPQTGTPLWAVRLEIRQSASDGEGVAHPSGHVGAPSRDARSLAFYPVIDGDRVYVADGRYVTGYQLLTGQRVLEYDLFRHHKNEESSEAFHLPLTGDLSHTLTIHEGRAYARLGGELQGSRARRGDEAVDSHSFLVCINLHPGQGARLERWSVISKGISLNGPMFEGAPLVVNDRVYAAESRVAAGQVQTAIVCCDADTGSVRWRRDVCEAPESHDGHHPGKYALLTAAGTNVVYCSHSGAVVALDGTTGRRSWSVRYASRGYKLDTGQLTPRSLCPCLYGAGRLFVAPEDYGHVLCLDPATGALIWESSPLEAVHLLGIAGERLVTTCMTPAPCIRALDIVTGNAVREWLQPADGSGLATFGRGLLAGDLVFWPTRGKTGDRLYVVRAEDGEPLDYADLNCGNLASANGYLVVAGMEDLTVYAPEASRPRQPRDNGAGTRASARNASPHRFVAAIRKATVPALAQRGREPILPQNLPRSPSAADDPVGRLPLKLGWQVWAAEQERFLLPDATESRFFSFNGPRLTCRDSSTGEVCWDRLCPFAIEWAGAAGARVLVAGKAGIGCYLSANGQECWELIVSPLADFHIVGERLYCLWEARLLLAVEVNVGRLAWQTWAPAAKLDLPYPAGCYASSFYADESGVLMQTLSGRSLLVDARQGRIKYLDWLPAGPRRKALSSLAPGLAFLPQGTRVLSAVSTSSGKEVWRRAIDRTVSLDGLVPQVLSDGRNLLVAVGRTYGSFVESLDPQSGAARWREAQFVGADAVNLTDGLLTDSAAYFLCGDTVEAMSLEDGTTLWKQDLPRVGKPWRIKLAGERLLIFPGELPAYEWRLFAWTPLVAAIRPAESLPGAHLPIVIIDARSGRIEQQIHLYASRPRRSSGLRLPLPETPFASRLAVGVQISHQRILVTAKNMTCALAPRH